MDVHNLFKGVTVSVKSIGGKKQVWVQAGRQQFPIANLTELEEEMRYCSSRFLFEGVRRWGW